MTSPVTPPQSCTSRMAAGCAAWGHCAAGGAPAVRFPRVLDLCPKSSGNPLPATGQLLGDEGKALGFHLCSPWIQYSRGKVEYHCEDTFCWKEPNPNICSPGKNTISVAREGCDYKESCRTLQRGSRKLSKCIWKYTTRLLKLAGVKQEHR